MRNKYIILNLIIKKTFGNKDKLISGSILLKTDDITECVYLIINEQNNQVNPLTALHQQILLENYATEAYSRERIYIKDKYNLYNIKLYINREKIEKTMYNDHHELYKEALQYIRKEKLKSML